MIASQRKVGRLVEVRAIAPLSDAEVDEFARQYVASIARTPSKVVICFDMRAAQVLPEAHSKALVDMLRRTNVTLERSSFLIDSRNATLCLQLTRIVREAASQQRRVFTDSTRMTTWLDEVLSKEEQARLRMFLTTLELDVSRSSSK